MQVSTKPLQSLSLGAVGFFGLNTQDSGITIDPAFAALADNCVIDKFGRIGSRKGFEYVTNTTPALGTLNGMLEFRDDLGVDTTLAFNGNGFFKKNVTELQSIGAVSSAGKWKGAVLNDSAFFFQNGEDARVLRGSVGSIETVASVAGSQGTIPQGDVVMAAYGRLFVAGDEDDPFTVYFSTVNNGFIWGDGTNPRGFDAILDPTPPDIPNTAGTLNLRTVFTNGPSPITGLGAINGRLIIFCEDAIVIYADNDGTNINLDPFTLRLVEVITGVGCVSPDTVHNTGDDIVFLSKSGVRSLGRTIQEQAQPFNDYSKNVRDDLVDLIRLESNSREIKGVYSETNAFYLVHFPSASETYCFDTRQLLPDGSARVTRWPLTTFSYLYQGRDDLYVGKPNDLATYSGFSDNGTPYLMDYKGTFQDLGDATVVKFLKRIRAAVVGSSSQQVTFNVLYDYEDDRNLERTFNTSIKATGTALYGLAEFGEDVYAGGQTLDNIQIPASGSGTVVQIGLKSEISLAALSLQKLDLYLKTGRKI